MIADELNQDDIDALLGGLGDGDADSGTDDALSALSGLGEADGGATVPSPVSSEESVELPEFESGDESEDDTVQLEKLLSDVSARVKIRLGRTEMLVEDILQLKPGRVVQLDSMSGDPVDVLVNEQIIAKGEVIILNEAFCVRVTEIFSTREKLERQDK